MERRERPFDIDAGAAVLAPQHPVEAYSGALLGDGIDEDNEGRDKFGNYPGIIQRGDRLQMSPARIELAMSGLAAVDRLLVLNQALSNVLHDDAGRACSELPAWSDATCRGTVTQAVPLRPIR